MSHRRLGRTVRDPRVNPWPGDILSIGTYPLTREFVEILPKNPQFSITDVSFALDGHKHQKSISQWRQYAKEMEVIRRVSRWDASPPLSPSTFANPVASSTWPPTITWAWTPWKHPPRKSTNQPNQISSRPDARDVYSLRRGTLGCNWCKDESQ